MKRVYYAMLMIVVCFNLGWSHSNNEVQPTTNTPDLIVVNQTVSPTVVLLGSSYSVSCDVTNIGTVSATKSRLGYYFSTDTIWDVNTDTYLEKDIVGNTQVGQLKPENATFTLPTNLTADTFYILFVADYLNVITEGDETNNVSYHEIIVSDQLPNITTYNNTDTLDVVNTSITIGLVAQNDGLSASPANKVAYYLSTDTVVTTSDYLIGEDMIQLLAVNDTAQKMITVDIATLNNIPSGIYYAGYILDKDDDIYELNENDNVTCFKNVPINKPNFLAADLVVQNIASSTNSVTTNGTFTVSSKVKNIGNGNAGASKLGYYFSTNATFNPNSDILLTDDQVTSLSPNTTDSETATLSIPAGTAAGTYYILFVADYLNAVNEANENNNVGVKTIQVAATDSNLKVLAGSGNLNFNGNIITISVDVENDGLNTTPSCVLGYYLSSNANITASDYLIGTDTVGALSPNSTISKTITVDVSAFGNIPTGNYYVGVLVDNQDIVPETNETDNSYFWTSPLFSHTSVSQSDLIVQNIVVNNPVVGVGNSISVSSQVKNIGYGSAQQSRLGYYLSADPALSPLDIYLDDDQVTNLNVNGIDGETANLVIPANTPNGTYYLLFVADYLSAVPESNETNNVSYKIITVNSSINSASNLAIIANTASLSVSGTSVNIDLWVENTGIDTSDLTSIGYYLSTDATIDASDFLIGTDTLDALFPSDSTQEIFTIDIATLVNILAGTYYVGCKADFQNTVAESNELDNTYYWALTQVTQVPYFPSDLMISNAQATPNTIAPGSNIFVSAEIENTGIGTSLPTTIGYYLSTDNVLSATDLLLSQQALDTIAINQTMAVSATVTIPASWTSGSYYLIVKADNNETVYEVDETNNHAFEQITIDANLAIAPFSWTPTNQSGVFLGQAQVGGVNASPNDWIAAIGPNGECAGAVQIINNGGLGYISLPIYGDDQSTSADEGMSNGEYFTLRLYDASANRYRDYPSMAAQFQFTQWTNTNGATLPAYNSTDSIYDFAEYITDTVVLQSGWNLISIDVAPHDSLITTLFDELIFDNTLEYITGFNNGSTLFDATGNPAFNTLTHFTRGYGYWVKMSDNDTLLVDGLPMTDWKIDLEEGWNLAGYVPQTSVAPTTYYQTLIDSSNLLYVTGFDNGVTTFDPNGAAFLNTLTTLNNGFGYWVKSDTSVQASQYKNGSLGYEPTNIYDFVNGTTNLTEPEYVGEIIKVLDEEGIIVATLTIAENGYIMTTSLYGDDLLTPEKDGIDINDPLYFEYKGIVLDEGIYFQGNMSVFSIDLYFDKAIISSTDNIDVSNTNFSCYPNPVINRMTIDYELSASAEVVLNVYNVKGQLVTQQLLGNQMTGQQQAIWLPEGLAEGLHIVELTANGQVIGSEKVMLK